MSRVCCYFTSGDDFYCGMVLTSIYMLRSYNPNIKINVFVIDAKGETKIDRFAPDLNINVVHREGAKAAKDSGYFCLNRCYMDECEEDSVLHIDGDTFIFGDIEKIFDRYADKDFAGAPDDWITGTPDWSGDDLRASYDKLDAPEVPVFNGGLTLWNNKSVHGWAGKWLEKYCQMCWDKETPITPWLYGDNRNCYHRETFSVCFYVAKAGLSYGVMDRKDVVNLFGPKQLAAWNVKDYIVYHCFTQNWWRLARQVRGKKRLVAPRLISSDGGDELDDGLVDVHNSGSVFGDYGKIIRRVWSD